MHYHSTIPIRCGRQIHHQSEFLDFCTPQYALVWLVRGSGVLRTHGQDHVLQCGDAFQRFPEQPHQLRVELPAESYWAAVPASVFALFQELHPPGWDRPVLHLGQQAALRKRWLQLIPLMQACPPHRQAALATTLQQLLIDCLHLAKSQEPGPLPAVDQACQLLAQSDLSIPQIAARVSLSPSGLRAACVRILGLSPQAYRLRCRLERAQHLLLGGATVHAVAEELGYHDDAAFSRQFKQHIGLSPSAWLALQ